MKYCKVEYKNVVFYIEQRFLPIVFADQKFSFRLLRTCDYAINKKTNQIIKCRYPLEDMFDKILGGECFNYEF